MSPNWRFFSMSFLRSCVGEGMISTWVFPTVKHGGGGVVMWGYFASDSVCDLFGIQGTLNQHGNHSILQRYHPIWFGLSPTIICFSIGQWPNTPPGCVRAIWPRRRVTDWYTGSQPNWNGLGWVGQQRDVKAAKKCSAYVGTPSRLLEKHSRWSWLRECQECAKLSKASYFEESKIYFALFNTFLVTTWFHVLFDSFDVFTIILQCISTLRLE